jgi:AraC family transcriptional regulator
MAVATLQRGPITAYDYRCEARPGDKPFPEQHESMSVSYVRYGSFGYRARGKSYELVAGSVLVGNAGDEFTCTHDYAHGDECLSFHIAGDVAEEIAPAGFWRIGCLPPMEETAVFGELAQAAAQQRSHLGLDEAAMLLAHRAAAVVCEARREFRLSERDRRRAVEAALWIDEHWGEDSSLHAASAVFGLSPFHFLRIFTRVVGATPHQYVIRSRLRHAARALASSRRSVTEIALECGFNDLSNFARAFRRAAGNSPSAFRNFCKA